jgi:hypothetical protein
MKRISAFLAASGAAALLAPAALAQVNTGVADAQFETIVSVSPDARSMVVQNAAGQQRTILLSTGTTVTRPGRPGTTATTIGIGDIGAGDRIVIEGAARQGGFNAQRIQVFAPGTVVAPPAGVVSPGVSPGVTPPGATPGVSAPGTANPAAPPSGTANPAAPPTGTGAPDGSNPAAPPPGSVRPGDPNTAAPGGSPANPASPPGSVSPGNPAAPPPSGGGAGGAGTGASPM